MYKIIKDKTIEETVIIVLPPSKSYHRPALAKNREEPTVPKDKQGIIPFWSNPGLQ